jgi:hypothetical protein
MIQFKSDLAIEHKKVTNALGRTEDKKITKIVYIPFVAKLGVRREDDDIPPEGKVSNFRVTEDMICSKIKNIDFTVMPSGKAVVCEITLENGFTVRGESAVVDPANFILEIGQNIAFTHAVDKIWEVEGYLMQERKYQYEKNS